MSQDSEELKVGDVVIVKLDEYNYIIESIGKIRTIHNNGTITVEYFSTSALYPNWCGVYEANMLNKLDTHTLYHMLRTREVMLKFRSMKEGVL